MASAADDQSKSNAAGYPPGPGPLPQASGYSTPQPYPGYPPPHYQGYPPPAYPGYPNNYPYTAAPPATYYQQHIPIQPEPSSRATFARFILTVMTVLVLGAFTMSLLTWLIFGADIPSFYVQSMTVPSFNITNSSLKASWDVNITIKNSNNKLEVFFERLEGVIAYEDASLALSSVAPFHVGTRQEFTFNMKLSTSNVMQESIVVRNHEDMVRERSKQTVTFGLKLITMTIFRSGSLWRRQATLKVLCENLQVKFAGPDGPGMLVGGDHKECLIYV